MSKFVSRLGIAFSAAALGAFCLPAVAQERDELWEITMTMDMPGMPMAMPAHTSRKCIAKGANDENFVPKEQDECKTVDSKRAGNKYTFRMVCDGKNKMSANGEITFSDGAYDGRMQMTGTMEGQPMNMNQTYSGKRVGSCTAPPKAK
jgi:Protein of unknown function (DUF3617)